MRSPSAVPARKQRPISKEIKQIISYHNAKANRNRMIIIIQTTTLKQEPQPSSKRSKTEPIPLNIQPKMPPPVKTMSISARIPMISSISIYLNHLPQ